VIAANGLLGGCEAKSVPTSPGVCEALPLSQYCSGGSCPDYEAAVANTRRHAATATGICIALIGTCGGLRSTLTSGGFEGTELFFDDGGRLVAVRAFTDFVRPGDPCRNETYYGAVVRCTPEIQERLCGAR